MRRAVLRIRGGSSRAYGFFEDPELDDEPDEELAGADRAGSLCDGAECEASACGALCVGSMRAGALRADGVYPCDSPLKLRPDPIPARVPVSLPRVTVVPPRFVDDHPLSRVPTFRIPASRRPVPRASSSI